MCCSFFEIAGKVWSEEERSRNRSSLALPLFLCNKDIKNNLQFFQFAGVETEVDLIFATCGIFEKPALFSQMTICPYHRSSLGIGWRASAKLCCVPENVSGHSERGPLKAERGLSLRQSTKIYEVTNVLLPVGSGKVLNVFRPKIDCRVGGNSCSLPFKTTPPPDPQWSGLFCCRMQARRQEVTFVIYSLICNVQHVIVHLYSAGCVKLVKSKWRSRRGIGVEMDGAGILEYCQGQETRVRAGC